ncbi:polysaccharide deacetylase family protein [Actinoplanes siamensis]|uniref:NodB homology domain-containing protein n=1 Tax=Actinoplanes siamensis TaxID=1223317 RepID=A0A919NEZ1_9ACTN|nr:polysaccharide deacetylase family protein [Actinoplanes siamensis]GIF09911.1 hypothetical protein Asi03nite_74490 [Actinoplanes siamensis]
MSWARPRSAFLGPSLRSATDSPESPTLSRPARHRAGDTGSYSTVRTTGPGEARHSAGPRRSRSKTRAKRPVTGSHRAPGTLPLETWLAAAKNRPTTVLGTLVVAGLLITAVPLAQPGRGEDPGELAAAAQAAASAQAAQQREKAGDNGARESEPPADPVAGSTARPTPSATVTGKPAEYHPVAPLAQGAGPGKSLLTTGTDQVALTFDDGPDPEQTPKILAMLEQYQVKATFCLVGTQAERHPELVRQIVAAGHTLCNHTFDHDLTIAKKPAQIRADLARTNAAIRAAVPGAPIPFFRAPGGNFNDKLVQVAHGDGMASLYWEVDPRDWEHLDGESDAAHTRRVITSVKQQVKPGAIVLSHDFNQPDTIAAYKELLPWLTKNFQLGIPSGTGETPKPPATTEPIPATPGPSATTTTEPDAPAETPSSAPTE